MKNNLIVKEINSNHRITTISSNSAFLRIFSAGWRTSIPCRSLQYNRILLRWLLWPSSQKPSSDLWPPSDTLRKDHTPGFQFNFGWRMICNADRFFVSELYEEFRDVYSAIIVDCESVGHAALSKSSDNNFSGLFLPSKCAAIIV